MFRLEFETENEAFSDGRAGYEIARILHKIAAENADRDYCGVGPAAILDGNGNRVDQWEWECSA